MMINWLLMRATNLCKPVSVTVNAFPLSFALKTLIFFSVM